MNSYVRTTTSRWLIAAAAIMWAISSHVSAAGKSLSGVVQTGGTTVSSPLANAVVTLLEATSSLPTEVGRATTDAVVHATFAIILLDFGLSVAGFFLFPR